jgi:hypothetical protein
MQLKLLSNEIQEEHRWNKLRETKTSNEITAPVPDYGTRAMIIGRG